MNTSNTHQTCLCKKAVTHPRTILKCVWQSKAYHQASANVHEYFLPTQVTLQKRNYFHPMSRSRGLTSTSLLIIISFDFTDHTSTVPVTPAGVDWTTVTSDRTTAATGASSSAEDCSQSPSRWSGIPVAPRPSPFIETNYYRRRTGTLPHIVTRVCIRFFFSLKL